MTKQHNFDGGLIDESSLGRVDLESYRSALRSANNVFVTRSGSIATRPGSELIRTLAGVDEVYGYSWEGSKGSFDVVLVDLQILILQDGVLLETLTSPFDNINLRNVRVAFNDSRFYLTHKDIGARYIENIEGNFLLVDFLTFMTRPPAIQYEDYSGITLNPTGTDGAVDIIASDDFFRAGHVGTIFFIRSKRVNITNIINPTRAEAVIIEELPSGATTDDWEEQAYSDARGWPNAVAFHQNRLVLAGGGEAGGQIHLSKIGKIGTFRKTQSGVVTDDSGVAAVLSSNESTEIQHVLSMGALVVFHSRGVTADFNAPITPTSVSFQEQLALGSSFVPPVLTTQGAVYLSSSGDKQSLILLTFDQFSNRLQSADIGILFSDELRKAVWMDYTEVSPFSGLETVYLRTFEGKIIVGSIKISSISFTEWTFDNQITLVSLWALDNSIRIASRLPNGITILGEISTSFRSDFGTVFSKSAGSNQITGLDTAYVGDTLNWISGNTVSGDVVALGTAVTDDDLIGVEIGEIGWKFDSSIQPLSQTFSENAGRLRPLNRGRIDIKYADDLKLKLLDSKTRNVYSTETIVDEGDTPNGWKEFEIEDDGEDRDPSFELTCKSGRVMELRQHWFFRG